jgi:hypothetical protein
MDLGGKKNCNPHAEKKEKIFVKQNKKYKKIIKIII